MHLHTVVIVVVVAVPEVEVFLPLIKKKEANCIMRGHWRGTEGISSSRNLRSTVSILHRFCQCIRYAKAKAKTVLAELELKLES